MSASFLVGWLCLLQLAKDKKTHEYIAINSLSNTLGNLTLRLNKIFCKLFERGQYYLLLPAHYEYFNGKLKNAHFKKRQVKEIENFLNELDKKIEKTAKKWGHEFKGIDQALLEYFNGYLSPTLQKALPSPPATSTAIVRWVAP